MGARTLYPTRDFERGAVTCAGSFVTTTSGTIGTNVDRKTCGFTVVKVESEAGRYRCTFDPKVEKIFLLSAKIVGAADDAYTTGKGLIVMLRNKTPASRVVDVQFVKSTTSGGNAVYADADVENAVTVDLVFKVVLA